ncbi:MAG: molybdate ABC transporter permease subunit [Anaerolineae bacterium]
MNWPAFWLSVRVAGTALVGIILAGVPLSLLLARVRFRGKLLLEMLITLPLVLPPTVMGYYLLIGLGQNNPLVRVLGVDMLFTWQAAAFASMVVGLPLMVQAARAAFEGVSVEVEEAALVDGASRWQVWWHVILPMARGGILAGLIMGGMRALGEFGATLMIAGNIPGRTQTLPLAIYDAVQSRQYTQATLMVLVMTGLAFSGLWVIRRFGSPPDTQALDYGKQSKPSRDIPSTARRLPDRGANRRPGGVDRAGRRGVSPASPGRAAAPSRQAGCPPQLGGQPGDHR